ncbi:MAG: heme-binding domain-containing protein [Pyrinomonadaceae bacterium]|nr:heme-binding domain-containing protein [Acidobacteriota bacterium]
MRKKLKWLVVVSALLFVALQFTSPARTNPPIEESQALEATTEVPPQLAEVLARSCNDCHSNRTNWRWYNHIAPASWFTVGHVNDGRAELNFSEWGSYGARMKETRLQAICYHAKQHSMPLASYTRVHANARLTDDEAQMLCEWSRKESKKLSDAQR